MPGGDLHQDFIAMISSLLNLLTNVGQNLKIDKKT